MNIDSLPTIITLLIAVSVATERGVEITKSLWPWLDTAIEDPVREGRRRAMIHFLAVVFGVGIAALSWPVIAQVIQVPGATATTAPARSAGTILAVGLLASGGSGFWNSMLTYVSSLKTLKSAEAKARSGEPSGAVVPEPAEGRIGG